MGMRTTCKLRSTYSDCRAELLVHVPRYRVPRPFLPNIYHQHSAATRSSVCAASSSFEAPGPSPSPRRATRKATSPPAAPAAAVRKVVGVDYGVEWTGLATGEAGLCSPLSVHRTGDDLSALCRLVIDAASQSGSAAVVVGLPVQPGGSLTRPDSDTLHGRRCRDFGHTLALLSRKHGLQVLLYDESDTTNAALLSAGVRGSERLASHRSMSREQKNREQIDAWAAAMMLHAYYAAPGRAVRINVRTG